MSDHSAPVPDARPRILHLLKWLPRGGIETWLTHVFSASTDRTYQHEVLIMQDEVGPYEDKVRAAGVIIHKVPMDGKAKWFHDLYRFLNKEGPFAAFHAHVDSIIAGPALAVAAMAGVKTRIIHNHAARSTGVDYQKLRYRVREGIGNAIAMRASTRAIGISDVAMTHLAGKAWKQREDCTILLYGFDYSAFRNTQPRVEVLRASLNIGPETTVIGHVGRFDPVKNHAFLLNVFADWSSRHQDAVLVLVGRGPLRSQYEEHAAGLGIAEKVMFVGGTDDVAAYMRLFDLFIFTSFSEGLGIVLLEAQAAGTPVLMPDNMPREVVVVEEGVTSLPLDAGVTQWSHAMDRILVEAQPDPATSLARVEGSSFGMGRCVTDLDAIYMDEFKKIRP